MKPDSDNKNCYLIVYIVHMLYFLTDYKTI